MGKKLLSKLKIENVKRGTAKRILALFSAITVFVTTYSLILPALTIDDETAEKEPGFDVVQTEENGKFVLRDSLQQEAAEKISRFSICSDLSVGAVLTDGSFDEGVKMGVEAVDNEDIINAAVDATDRFDREPVKVRAVKISFKDENDEEYSPEAPLDLTLSGKGITDATNPVIVRVDKDGKAEEVEPKDFGELLYLKDESSPVYAVVETKEITRRTLTAEGSDYKISVEYGEDANIPNSAELRATELKQGSTVYSSLLNQAKEEIPDDRIVSDARFFDITILNDGEEIEPESEVNVKITYNDSLELQNDSELMAVHFTDNGAEINKEVKTADTKDGGSEVSFKQSSFSTTGTLITNTSQLENGKSYVLVAEKNGRYYAVSNSVTSGLFYSSSTCPQYEVSLDIDGTTATFSNLSSVPKNITWKYSVSNNSAVLRNNGNNRYLALSANNTMTTTDSANLTLENAGNGKITIRRGTSNYRLYLPSDNTNFQISNSNSTPLYFIEYDTNKQGEYQIRFHYVDGEGNEISPTVERNMQYSTNAVDLRDSSYAINVPGYKFMEPRYGAEQGDRVRYIQNDRNTSSGEIIVNLKNDAMYAASQSNAPLITTTIDRNIRVPSNVTDRIDLTNRPDHIIDLYMVYNADGAPDPNEIIRQKESTGLPQDEFPLGAPDHTKKLVPNYTDGAWDGTYTLYLDVTGKAASVEKGNKADIILVYDTSNSMREEAQNGKLRYEIANEVVTDMAKTLLAYNTSGETDPTVRIGVVSYASTAKIETYKLDETAETPKRVYGYVDNKDDFKTGFKFASEYSTYDKGASGGTNWEDGLQTARALYNEQHRPDAEQYIIFVSDGEPTCRVTRGDYYQNRDIGEYSMSNNNTVANPFTDTTNKDSNGEYKQYYARGYGALSDGGYYYTGVEHCYSNAKDDARSFVDTGANLYTVGIFSTEEKLKQMNTLANYAYSGYEYADVDNDRYKYASSVEVMHEVFAYIVHQIMMDYKYGNVEIKDIMTAAALTTGELSGHATDFKYYKNPAGGNLTEWADAPAASYNSETRTVDWNLAQVDMLKENVTYTVAFTVWPDQDSYDAIMVLNDMIDEGKPPAQVDEYAQEHYPDIYPLLKKDDKNHYIVQSNAEAELSYERFIVENDGEPRSLGKEKAGYSYPNMETTTYNMSVSKIWNDNLYDDNRFKSVIFNIYEDYDETPGAVNEPYATVTLDASDRDPNDPYRWTETIEISPGIIKTEVNGTEPINPGHRYRVFEVGYIDKSDVFHDISNPDDYDDYRYEFVSEEVTPMLYDGHMVFLNDADDDGGLSGTNNLRGGINLYKKVLDADGNEVYTNEDYEFVFNVDIPKKYVIGHDDQGNPIYDSNAYPLWYTVYTDVNHDGKYNGPGDTNGPMVGMPDLGDGYGTLEDGDHVKIKPDQMLRIINVPIGTQYTFEEVNLAYGREFVKAELIINDEVFKTQEGPDSDGKNKIGGKSVANASHDNIFYNRMTSNTAMQIVKIDAEHPETTLAGAVFNLYKLPEGADEIEVTDPIDLSTLEPVTVSGETDLESGPDGIISIPDGLSPGVYYLFETVAPDKYDLFKFPIKITVTDSGTVVYKQQDYNAGQLIDAELTTPEGGVPTLIIYAADSSGVTLPHTGGAGVWLYTVGGILLIGIAVLTLGINLKRRRCERRKE